MADGEDNFTLMMDDGALRIAPIVVPVIEGLGFEIVRLSFFAGNLQVMAEQPDGSNIGIDDCGTISRAIATRMDEADPIAEAYTLEISSPGIDRPLTRPKDFARWAGFEARLETLAPIDGQAKFKGRLIGIEDGLIMLRDETGADRQIEFAQLRRARLILNDELLAAHKRAA